MKEIKCVNCECHTNLTSGGNTFLGDYRYRGHYCEATVLCIAPIGSRISKKYNKRMSYKESRKHPEWCPKTKDEILFEGVECKVISVT